MCEEEAFCYKLLKNTDFPAASFFGLVHALQLSSSRKMSKTKFQKPKSLTMLIYDIFVLCCWEAYSAVTPHFLSATGNSGVMEDRLTYFLLASDSANA